MYMSCFVANLFRLFPLALPFNYVIMYNFLVHYYKALGLSSTEVFPFKFLQQRLPFIESKYILNRKGRFPRRLLSHNCLVLERDPDCPGIRFQVVS